MIGQRSSIYRFFLIATALVGGTLLLLPGARGEGDREENFPPVRIGMADSLFRDVPEPLVRAMMAPFGSLMQSQTGLTGKLVPGGDAEKLGKQLAEDKLELGVFPGIEFGWARLKYPELKPLTIAVNQDRHLHAFILVRADDEVKDLCGLKGKSLAVPKRSRQHCCMFLDKRCQDPNRFFSQITTPPSSEDALDDVVDGEVKAALIDSVALDCFQRRKPARYARLKVIEKSEVFPAGVVAYHPGILNDATLKKFRDGMINANKNALGRQLMTMWKLTAFEPVPPDYDQTLVSIVKAYPPPPPPPAPAKKPKTK